MNPRTLAALAALVLVIAVSPRLKAQACCSGASVLTPARLVLHEAMLVGLELEATHQFGSYDRAGTYRDSPSGTSEQGFAQNVFFAVRVFERGQLSLLVPFVETRRATPAESSFGGGIGDVNLGARYEFLDAGSSRVVPGIGLLAGVTLPTGTPPESASEPLATDATGVGAVQLNGGLALEQTFGSWLFGVTGLLAQRLPRTILGVRSRLGTELRAVASAGYAFGGGWSLATFASYGAEGDATVDGARVPDSGRRALTVGLAGSLELTGRLRLGGALFSHPPLSELGANLPASFGLRAHGVFAWLE